MKRGALIVTFLLTIAGTSMAATYELLLNKDEKLCPEIFRIASADLKKYGEVVYNNHALFQTIQWQPIGQVLREWIDKYPCGPTQFANFDMNNDGKEDFVVKDTGCLMSQPTDSVYLLDGENQAFSSYRKLSEILENSIGRFPDDSSAPISYDVRELPPTGKISEPFELTFYHSVGGWLTIQPFIDHGTAYLALTDETKGSFLIGKYETPTKLDAICFLEVAHKPKTASPSKKKSRG